MGFDEGTTCKWHLVICCSCSIKLQWHLLDRGSPLSSFSLRSLLYGCGSLCPLEVMPGAAPRTALSCSCSLSVMVTMRHIRAATVEPCLSLDQIRDRPRPPAESTTSPSTAAAPHCVLEEDWLADYPIHGCHLIHGRKLCHIGQHQRPNSCALSKEKHCASFLGWQRNIKGQFFPLCRMCTVLFMLGCQGNVFIAQNMSDKGIFMTPFFLHALLYCTWRCCTGDPQGS